MIYQLMRTTNKSAAFSSKENLIPEVFNSIKENFGKEPSDDDNSPIIYGLATAISAPVVVMITLSLLIVVLVVGDGMCLPLLALCVIALGWLLLNSISCWTNRTIG